MTIRTNRQILTKGKSYANKQAKKFGTDEVTFDKDSRLDYLTGFHKRKLERQKKAREFNKEQDRLAKIEERKKIRDERKQQLEQQLCEFKESLELEADIEEELDNDDIGEKESDLESWNGFDDEEEDKINSINSNGNRIKSILKKGQISTSVYDDNTTVEIESLEPNENFEYLAKINNVKLESSEKVLNQSLIRAKKYAKFLGMGDTDIGDNNDSSSNKKKKKKKFRYLTKNERKENQRKAYRNKHRH